MKEVILAARKLIAALEKTESDSKYNYLFSQGGPAWYYKRPNYRALIEDLETTIREAEAAVKKQS